MSCFVYKLIAPRSTFAQTMTAQEAALMQAHGRYWVDLVGKGTVVVFGPVADPAGTWGLAVIETDTEEDARTYAANDPAVTADIGFRFEVYPMTRVTLRTSAQPGR
jgi:uncharacterized protein YciI